MAETIAGCCTKDTRLDKTTYEANTSTDLASWGSLPEREGKEMACTTHHNACECREKMIQAICMAYLDEHQTLRQFRAGFKKATLCECPICKTIRKLYPVFKELE